MLGELVYLIYFVMTIFPTYVRLLLWGNILGFTTYFHTRMAHIIASGQFYDPLSFGGRPYTYPPLYHLLLALLPNFLYFIPTILAGFGILYLAKKFEEGNGKYVQWLLILMTGFIYLASHINPRIIALFCETASIYFLLNKKYLPSTLLSMIIFPLHPLIAFVNIVLLAVLGGRDSLKVIAPSLFFGGIYLFLYFSMNGLPQPNPFYSQFVELRRGLPYFFYESGMNADSFSIVIWALAFYGFVKTDKLWLKKWFLTSIFISLIIGNRGNIHIYLPAALLAAPVLKSLKRKYQYLILGYLALSTFLFLYNFTLSPPYPEDVQVLKYAQKLPGDTIFAPLEYGHWITAIAHKKSFADAYVEYAPNASERYALMKEALAGNITAIYELKKWGVDYIFFTYSRHWKPPIYYVLEQNNFTKLISSCDVQCAALYTFPSNNHFKKTVA